MMMRMRELDRMDLYNPLVNESWIEMELYKSCQ